nr:hypothetical protein [Tanacetum cinerariifolium]
MHNNIMAAVSRDRPPMLAPGRYPQWRSRFLRYVDTRPNGEALRKCIMSGPYKPTTVLVHAVEATDNSRAVAEHTTVETPANMSPENKAHFLAEKEAIHLILTGIGDDIYSTVDACQTAQEMSTFNFFNNFSRNGQGLFDILKQYQNEVNELHAEKLARNANLLALVATAQASQDQYYQTSSYMAKIQEVPTAESGIDSEPVEHVQNNVGYNVFTNVLQHSEQSELVSNTCLVEMDDRNVIPDSPDMCKDDIHNDQNDVESDDERVALANLIANLKLDVDENKNIQKQLKKANTTLAQELKE